MKLSIIITFYKNFSILYQCLHNLKNTLTDDCDIEIIIINDNPLYTLKNNVEIKNYFADLIVIDNSENVGYAEACNIAVNSANSDVIVLMDCDIMVTDNWLHEMYKLLSEENDAGGISSVILNMEDNSILHFGFATNKVDMIKPFFCRPINDVIRDIPDDLYEFPTLTSGCCMFKKSIYLQVGGMDKYLYNGYCDIDLFYKIKSAGYKNYVCRTSYVYHRGCVSGQVRTSSKTDTKALFCSKWGQYDGREGLEIINKIYKHNFEGFKEKYILFNFSSSLFSEDYIKAVEKYLIVQQSYKIKILHQDNIILEDVLSLSLKNSKFSFIYFCDDYRQLSKNYFWFSGRKDCKDIIVDRNGNVLQCNKLV